MTTDETAQYLCANLPEGWRVQIEMERGAATVKAIRPDDTEVVMGDGESDIDEQVRDAFRLARDETEAEAISKWPLYKCPKCGVNTNIPAHCVPSI